MSSYSSQDIGKIYRRFSTQVRPTADVIENSIIHEIDTEDDYRFNQYGRWEFIPPVGHKSKRIQSLFIPFDNEGNLIFGAPVWKGINAEMHASGCMIYQIRTSASVSEHTTDSPGYATVDDVAQPEQLPKCQVILSFNDTGANSAAFIGFKQDDILILDTTTAFIPNDCPIIGLGYRKTDSNLFIFHNDNSGAVNAVDLSIARSDDVYMLEVEFETSTSARVSLFDIDMTQIYNNTFTTEIPPTGIEMGFEAIIQNANTSDQYVINIFDFIRLEKNKAALNKTTDF
jgi:hypothetical protein